MKDFQVGMAKSDITPELGSLLFGYPSKRPSKKIIDGLKVKVIAIKQENEAVLLISADICDLGLDDSLKIREEISKKVGVKIENIIFSTTHTHSGPITRTSAGWGEADHDFVFGKLLNESIDASLSALKSLTPALMAISKVECYAGINRRELDKNGEIILGQNPDGPYDPQMTVIAFKTIDGENIGSLVHFATHPTVAGANRAITRDWPGIMVDRVEKITNAPCMYVNGAEGDIGPRLSNGKTIADDSQIEVIGKIAADSAEKAIYDLGEFKVPELKLESGEIFLPSVEAPSLESVEKDIEAMGDPEKLIEVDITKYSRLTKIKKMYESGQEFSKGITMKQTVISLDGLAIVPFTFEAFCNIALSLREKSPFDDTLLFGLSNGGFGYLPTEEQLPFGGYEVASFRAATIPGFIDSLDKYIVEENVKLLNKLYNN